MNTATDHVGKSEASDQELLQAQALIWNQTFNFINSMSLKCAVQLGIPDIIHNHGKPMTLSHLMDALKLDQAKAPCMHRLLRMLIHSGFFVNTKMAGNDDEKVEDIYILTTASKLLLKDHPASVRPFLLAMLDPIKTAPWHRVGDWFRSSDPNPFVTTHGRSLWDMARQEPRLNQFFNDAMASDALLVSGFIIGNYKQVFEGLNSLVDVGGGNGIMAKVIAEAFPEMKCTVLDLPHVVQGLEGTKNLSYVGGDMFQSIPTSDAILLKWVLHDWSDEECVKILKKCKEAIPSKEKGGNVLIIEMVLGDDESNIGDDSKATETQLFFDMQMLVMANGRERRERDWTKLFLEAGFCGYKIIPILGLRSLIEVYY